MTWHPRLVLFFALLSCAACGAPLGQGFAAPVRHADGAHRHAFVAALREGGEPHSLGRVAAAPAPQTYVVRRGDTLYSLARSHGVTVQELARLNGLVRPQDLQAGSHLRLPPAQAAGDAQAAAIGGTSEQSTELQAASAGADGMPQNVDAMSPAQRRVAELAGHPVAPAQGAPGSATQSAASASAAVGRLVGSLNNSGGLQWPIAGAITSQFGNRSGRPHDGIDIGARPGTDVRAAADGDVVFADAHGGYGNVVILRHGNGLLTIYAHSERNLVRKGQRVRAGDAIARVGATGRSRGPHLHFEVRQGTRPQNPLRYLPRVGR